MKSKLYKRKILTRNENYFNSEKITAKEEEIKNENDNEKKTVY